MAAKVKSSTVSSFQKKSKVCRPGVHAKTKTSKLTNSKNYRKSYKGQGR
jgi:hypothetical protein